MGMLIGDVVRVKVYCSFQDQIAINVRHIKATFDVTGGAELFEVAAQISGTLAGDYKALMVVGARFRGVGCQRVLPAPLSIEEFSAAGAGEGERDSDPLPTQTCGLVSLRTPLAGPRFRGRNYIPFPAEVDNEADGKPSDGYILGLSVIGGFWIAPHTTVGGSGSTTWRAALNPLGVASFINFQAPRDGWATQRRRSFFGAANVPFPVLP